MSGGNNINSPFNSAYENPTRPKTQLASRRPTNNNQPSSAGESQAGQKSTFIIMPGTFLLTNRKLLLLLLSKFLLLLCHPKVSWCPHSKLFYIVCIDSFS
jgi:hypothetical protein